MRRGLLQIPYGSGFFLQQPERKGNWRLLRASNSKFADRVPAVIAQQGKPLATLGHAVYAALRIAALGIGKVEANAVNAREKKIA